jgi:hypothetical protein
MADSDVAGERYWAKVVSVPRDWHDLRLLPFFALWGSVIAIFGWTGEGLDRDPRFRVVVGRHGSEDSVGVRVARSRRRARRERDAVEQDLVNMSSEQFARRYDLTSL